MPALTGLIDGGWFDIASLIVSAVYAVYRKVRVRSAGKWICRDTSLDILNGVALFPLLMLALSCVATKALAALEHSSPIILSVAGIVALFAVLEESEAET